MIDQNFVILGVLINLFGTFSYIRDTIKGKTKPNRVSWFMWSVAPLIAFAAELKQGVGIQSLTTFAVGFGPLLIFISSFVNKKSYWKLTRFDYLCGALSFAGLALWYITKVGNVAIFFSIIADGLAAIPTLIKSYNAPETENYTVYLFAIVNSGIALLTIKNWNFQTYGFPLYILLIDILLFSLVKFKLGRADK